MGDVLMTLGYSSVVGGYFYTAAILGIIGLLLFAIQLLLCFKVKRIAFKLIPAYMILFCILLSVLLYIGVFGTGFLSAERILAAILAMGTGAALVGDITAWVVYKIRLVIKENKA